MLSIGLMSGTSMDGIDAALLETEGTPHYLEPLGHHSISYEPEFVILLKAAAAVFKRCMGDWEAVRTYYPNAITHYLMQECGVSALEMRTQMLALSAYLYGIEQSDTLIQLDDVIQHSTHLHAQVVKQLLQKTKYTAAQIDVIGYHGQTLFHHPAQKISIIVGNGQNLAEQLGIPVVNDFRSQDVAAGGQGAPFAPLYHQALALKLQKIPMAVVNCGGIANITLIPNEKESDIIAFDTGPGNGLIDQCVRQRTGGQERMDFNGQYGKNGVVNLKILNCLYEKSIILEGKNYFLRPAPKALDIADLNFIPELALLPLEDACATLAAFTADTLVRSLDLVKCPVPPYWILSGGGWNNPVICAELEQRLQEKYKGQITILTANEVGWHNEAIEAQTFAYLAVRSILKLPLSLPNTTGVPMPLSGGRYYRPGL